MVAVEELLTRAFFALRPAQFGHAQLTESGNDRRVEIVIPSGGLADVERILSAMIQSNAESPEPLGIIW
jgi:hypothetical protein